MNFFLPETEKEIMNILWAKKQWMSGAEFWEYFNANGKSCKRQTINTYLTRMAEKGLLVKHQCKYMYAYTKEEFDQKKANEVLDMYEGSLKNFLSAITGGKKITHEEAEELRTYIDSLES